MHATSLSFESIIIRDDDPALPCGHQLAGLKTECARCAVGPDAPSFPFRRVGMRTVFDQHDSLALCEGAEGVEVRRVSTHMNGDKRLGPRGEGIFCKLCIQAVG